MNDQDSSDFRLGEDRDNAARMYLAELDGLRIDKLGQRLTFISVLLPCLMAALLALGYFYFIKQFDRINLAAVENVEKLTTDVESKFSSLSVRYAKLEDSLSKTVSSVKNTTDALIAEVNKAEETLGHIQSSTPDKKEMETALSKINQTLTPLQTELDKVSAEIRALDSKFEREIEGITLNSGRAETEIKQLQTRLDDFSSTITSRHERDMLLQNELRIFQQELDQTIKAIEAKLAGIQKRTDQLENATDLSRDKYDQIEKKLKNLSDNMTSKPREIIVPKPGRFYEQNIN